MEKITDSKWFARILALFFALLLFFNANSDGRPGKATSQSSLGSVVENVPIKLTYDDSKYYIAGYEDTTTVYLSSGNRVLLDLETNDQTRNFKLVADLSKFKEGNYEVPIEVTNLNSAVQATLKEKTIHVRIEKRETRVFEVVPKVNDNLLKNGYSLDNITIDPSKVEITSGDKTLDLIDKVLAPIEDDRDLSDDLSKRVDLIAVDKEGNLLSVIIVPSTVTLTVRVEAPSKSVPLKVYQSGSISQGIKSFEFEPAYENVTISGSREMLSTVNAIELYIDTSKIIAEKTETHHLVVPDGISVLPESVEVKVIPVMSDKKKTNQSSEPASSSSKTADKTSSSSR